jgi:hypothetical protein
VSLKADKKAEHRTKILERERGKVRDLMSAAPSGKNLSVTIQGDTFDVIKKFWTFHIPPAMK